MATVATARRVLATTARRAAPRTFASDAYLGAELETSTLPNGVVVTTTAPGAPLTCVGISVGRGAAHGPRGAALAASLNAFKTARGRTDLRIQRDLEVAGSAPYSIFDAHRTVTVCTQNVVTRAAPCVADAFGAAVLAAGIGRDALTAWEFEETKVSPFALNALERHASLEDQVASAAYGKAYQALGSAADLQALSSTDVDAWLAEDAPITAVGLGMEHASMMSLAQNMLGDLAARPSTTNKYPAFQAGGVVALSGGAGCAIAVPAPADVALARVLATAVGGSVSQGLVVVSGADKEACTVQLQALGDVAAAKAAAASALLELAPEDLAALVAGGQDPSALYAAILALEDAAVSKAHAAATAQAPAAAIAA